MLLGIEPLYLPLGKPCDAATLELFEASRFSDACVAQLEDDDDFDDFDDDDLDDDFDDDFEDDFDDDLDEDEEDDEDEDDEDFDDAF